MLKYLILYNLEPTELLACISPLSYSYSRSCNISILHWIAIVELPAILDSLFYGLVNTTSTSIGVEGEGGREP